MVTTPLGCLRRIGAMASMRGCYASNPSRVVVVESGSVMQSSVSVRMHEEDSGFDDVTSSVTVTMLRCHVGRCEKEDERLGDVREW